MLHAGVMLTSRVDMVKVWPEIWANDTAARRTLEELEQEPQRELFAQLLHRWRKVEYQLHGPKMNRRTAYIDPTRIADPKAWLEERLGPLELFEPEEALQPEAL
jgi:putative DNA primase/helicase